MNSEDAWQHACVHFGQPGVAQALLREQDERGLDIVLHLFAAYLRERLGVLLDAAALAEADRLVKPWRDEVIRPLRALRRSTKDKPAPGAGGEHAYESVRQLLKEAELRAERAELDALCAWFGARKN